MSTKLKFRKNELPWGLEITQFVFLILSILCSISFTIDLFNYEKFDLNSFFVGVKTLIFWALFYGTFKVRNWVVTPVLIYSAYVSISNLLGILAFMLDKSGEITQKTLTILLTIFFLFQLFIFTRPKTKEFFKENGTTFNS